MTRNALVPSLMLFTLIAVAVIAIGLFAYFMRKRSNRHPMDTPAGHDAEKMRAHEIEDARRDVGK